MAPRAVDAALAPVPASALAPVDPPVARRRVCRKTATRQSRTVFDGAGWAYRRWSSRPPEVKDEGEGVGGYLPVQLGPG